jgi:hypothetical protein
VTGKFFERKYGNTHATGTSNTYVFTGSLKQLLCQQAAGIAQSVWRLATGWTVWGSNPRRGEVFPAVQARLEVHPASSTMGRGYFPGVKRPDSLADHPCPFNGGMRVGWTYTSASPLLLHRQVIFTFCFVSSSDCIAPNVAILAVERNELVNLQ